MKVARRLLPRLDLRPVIAETSFAPEDLQAVLDAPSERCGFRCYVHGLSRRQPWIVTGLDPLLSVAGFGDRLRVRRRGGSTLRGRAHPLAVIDALAAMLPGERHRLPFAGGSIGYLGYGVRTFVEEVPDRGARDVGLPDYSFAVPDRFWTWCVQDGPVMAVAWVPRGESSRRAARELRERRSLPPRAARTPRLMAHATRPRSNFRKADYLAAVRRIREYIIAGDIYQANLSQRFRVPLTRTPGEIWRRLVRINPAPYAAYLACEEGTVLSVSPERFLTIDGDRIVTEPIKGTRARRGGPRADRAATRELLASAKDRAELAMIVDLERNDLGRICRYGSVKVRDARRLETHPTVHHLVATVEGRLRPGVKLSEVIAATFPGGSVTGAPKIRAMEIIDELEPHARSVYTGALGTIGCDGRMDLSVCIRVLIACEGEVFVPVGGGIVFDSEPEAEYAETLAKAVAQVEALT